ncbi:hypothetical protein M3A49_26680 [Paraburkholderia sp. CNPSo 3076]|uniref:hypothetical protein n=1 Tax=Paraburkholderia sp. CNPSo 3076 TaxID=2940936 RepID=UPI0022506C79|nr:hypothetical protein [Paraburkholderia sp. CNPSo 3076]MCX5543031.1 hypothetical protein [Paraburkholderia sp. CNPSo 3076]
MIHHPYQDQHTVVTNGQHAGRKGKVVGAHHDLTNGAGDYFVEIEFDSPPGSKKTPAERDLVPSRYLDHNE